MSEQSSKFDSMWFVIPLALLLYVIPWVFNKSFVLSIGAYDFAELLAKRPFDDTTYLTTLALRGQLTFFTCLLALSIKRPYFSTSWWVHSVGCLILVIAQLPPLTFITNTADTNQQQQALLAGISLLSMVIGMSGYLWTYRYPIRLLLAIGGAITTLYGILNAIDVIDDYGLVANIGVGGIGLVILYVLLGIISLIQWLKQ